MPPRDPSDPATLPTLRGAGEVWEGRWEGSGGYRGGGREARKRGGQEKKGDGGAREGGERCVGGKVGGERRM